MATDSPPPAPGDIVAFWLEAGPRAWFSKDPAFDEAILLRFQDAHFAAARGEILQREPAVRPERAQVLGEGAGLIVDILIHIWEYIPNMGIKYGVSGL